MHIPMVAGSDSHFAETVGLGVTEIQAVDVDGVLELKLPEEWAQSFGASMIFRYYFSYRLQCLLYEHHFQHSLA